MTMTSATAASAHHHVEEDEEQFEVFLKVLRRTFTAHAPSNIPLFTSSATGLFDAFLGALPAHRRQHYTCNACRHFLERFGGLVLISTTGIASSLFWNAPSDYPPFFVAAINAMKRLVDRAHVTGVFLSEAKVWGTPEDKINKPPFTWTHMSITPPRERVSNNPLKTSEQAMAEKREEYEMLGRAVAEFTLPVVREAHALVISGNLYRAEKVDGPVKWLLDLHHKLDRGAGARRYHENILWRTVALAPAGFCHVRSGVLGTLLDDVKDGLPFEDIKQRFAEKVDPLTYQRTQSAPKAGNIATAEKIVSKLRSEGGLLRRFARLEDLQLLWRPHPQKAKPTKGVFSHLQPTPAQAQVVKQPPIVMTWEKFRREVLPRAEEIEFLVPPGADSFVGLVTAASPKSPPMLQWDDENRRNPVSWYFYKDGSLASRWGLRPRTFHRVSGITLQPSMWFKEDAFPQHGKKVFFLLEGAKDLQYGGAGFFPEMLRHEYHEIRATIEAHMNSTAVSGGQSASASGIGLQAGTTWNYTFRVTSNGVKIEYKLDRWD